MLNRAELFLGIDQGSSHTKGVVLDQDGTTLADWSLAVPEVSREGRCVEQDAKALLGSVVEAIDKGIKFAEEEDGRPIRALGLSAQRSGVLAWQGAEIMHPLITWADTRFQPVIDALSRGVEKIAGFTGIPTIANFAAPKIQFLQRRFLDQAVRIGTLDTFLIDRLSDGARFITEDSMAARTMLYSLDDRSWHDWLCSRFEVNRNRLASISPSLAQHFDCKVGEKQIPLTALLGDQQAGLLGSFGVERRPLLNLGTSASLSFDTGQQIVRKPGLKTSVLYSRSIPGVAYRDFRYLIENTSSVTGPVLLEPLRRSWVKDLLHLDELCNSAYQANPAGLATAYWVNRDTVTQLWPNGVENVTVCRAGHSEMDRVRAVVENVGNLIVRIIEECAEKGLLGERFPALIDVAGGGSASDYLMQYIADVSGHSFKRLNLGANHTLGARGAAVAAWMSIYSQGEPLQMALKSEGAREFLCTSPERRKRYLAWLKMEQDVLNRTLPGHAEIEGE